MTASKKLTTIAPMKKYVSNIFSEYRSIPRVKFIPTMLMVAILAACTAPISKTGRRSDTFDAVAATQTFASGFRHISERYIEPVSAFELALEGLRGLTTIDPSLQIQQSGNRITIGSDILSLHSYTPPATNDYEGWANLTVQILLDAQNQAAHYQKTKLDKLYEAVFDGSLSHLDAFSRYASVEQAKRNREKRSGFGGIGIRFKMLENGANVSLVFPGSPASNTGLRPKDIITHADGRSLVELKRQETGSLLRGKIGSIVEVKVLRPPARIPFNLSIKRDRIVEITATHSVKNGVVNIHVTRFNNHTAQHVAQNLAQALQEVHRQLNGKAKGVILDLRSNPGGLLKQAVNVSDLFLVNGRIISTRGRHPASDHDYDAKSTDIARGLPLVVLINGRSASASEIVAAALQDHDRAVVIGSTSFGKGTVQTVITLPNKAEITLTWSRFQTPSGYFLHGLGVSPSICATRDENSDAANVIETALGNAVQHTETVQAWHSVSTKQKRERQRLKEICPATNQLNPIDVKIAERLLKDTALYQRVKALNQAIAFIGK